MLFLLLSVLYLLHAEADCFADKFSDASIGGIFFHKIFDFTVKLSFEAYTLEALIFCWRFLSHSCSNYAIIGLLFWSKLWTYKFCGITIIAVPQYCNSPIMRDYTHSLIIRGYIHKFFMAEMPQYTFTLEGDSTPKETQDFRGVSLKRELVEQVENFVQEHPEYKSIADFVHESVRVRMEEVRKSHIEKPLPRFEHFNKGAGGVKITDRKRHRIADIYFRPEGIFCELDQTDDCEHIDFALTVPEIQDIIRKRRKEGWKLPEV